MCPSSLEPLISSVIKGLRVGSARVLVVTRKTRYFSPVARYIYSLLIHSGGLDGAFLVRKLEEMAVQARSSLLYDRATTESTQTDDVPPAVDVSSDGACIAASAAVDSSKSFGGVAPPSEAGDNMPVDQERATLQKAAPKRNKSKEKSKKGRRLGSGLIQSNSVINGKKKDNEGKAASENREGGSEGNEDSCHAPVDAASKNGSTVAPGAKTTEALREAETIEKLRWADEVSAAAAAAVAAAAREKKEAEARERAVSAAAAAAVAAAAREKKEAEARERAAVDGQASSPPRQQGDGDGHQDEMVPSVGDESREEGEIVVLPKAPDISEPVGRASEGEVSVSLSQNDAKEKNNDGDRTVGARPIGAPSAKHVVASEAGMAPVVNSLLPRCVCSHYFEEKHEATLVSRSRCMCAKYRYGLFVGRVPSWQIW